MSAIFRQGITNSTRKKSHLGCMICILLINRNFEFTVLFKQHVSVKSIFLSGEFFRPMVSLVKDTYYLYNASVLLICKMVWFWRYISLFVWNSTVFKRLQNCNQLRGYTFKCVWTCHNSFKFALKSVNNTLIHYSEHWT